VVLPAGGGFPPPCPPFARVAFTGGMRGWCDSLRHLCASLSAHIWDTPPQSGQLPLRAWVKPLRAQVKLTSSSCAHREKYTARAHPSWKLRLGGCAPRSRSSQILDIEGSNLPYVGRAHFGSSNRFVADRRSRRFRPRQWLATASVMWQGATSPGARCAMRRAVRYVRGANDVSIL